MEYFVSIENTPYYHWQLELLIESFKTNDCQNDLVISVADSNSPNLPHFCINSSKHPRKNVHNNVGEIRGYAPFNEFYSLLWCLANKKITQPFAILKPQIILREKPQITFVNDQFSEFIFYPELFFTFDEAVENVGPFWEWIINPKEYYESKWVPVGSIMMFNNFPIEFFQKTITLLEILATQQIISGRKVWEHTDKLAWAINVADSMGYTTNVTQNFQLAENMMGFSKTPFIDCQHGLPPHFNKSQFKYLPPNYVSFGDPFEILSQQYSSPNAHFISQLAQKNLDNR
jgi:hypothetical protein